MANLSSRSRRLQYLEDRVSNHVRREPLAHAHGQDVVEPGVPISPGLENRSNAEVIFARIDRLTLRQSYHNFRRAMPNSRVSNVDECAVVRLESDPNILFQDAIRAHKQPVTAIGKHLAA